MPANVTAIVVKAAPDAELACKAHETDFDVDGSSVRRGIISYYAASTMGQATSSQSWIDLMEGKSSEDLARHEIDMLHIPVLRIVGDPSVPVIGSRPTELLPGLGKQPLIA